MGKIIICFYSASSPEGLASLYLIIKHSLLLTPPLPKKLRLLEK